MTINTGVFNSELPVCSFFLLQQQQVSTRCFHNISLEGAVSRELNKTLNMAPPPDLMIRILSDVIRNIFTGYYEEPSPTNPARAETRLQNEVAACRQLLEQIVGPGDLLDSDMRADFAMEAYFAAGFVSDPSKVHDGFQTRHPFRDLAHRIVKKQNRLDEACFKDCVARLCETYTDHSLEDCNAMAVELGIIAALCDGVKTFYDGIGHDAPPLPPRPSPAEPANFKSVEDYSNGPLEFHKSIAWGPTLPSHKLKPDIVKKLEIDPKLWKLCGNYTVPTSKASAAPLTCMTFFKFMTVMYTSPLTIPRFLSVPGEDRHLTRGQLEYAAATYTGAKQCTF